MEESPVTKKEIVVAIFLSIIVIVIILSVQVFDSRTIIVFCDVGQGDATYIRIKNRVDILVDAGPDRKVLNCLGRYMPFYDREIELAILSHPQKDHFGGFIDILNRYKIDSFLTTSINNAEVQSFKRLDNKLKNKKVTISFVKSHDLIKTLDYSLIFYWPPLASKLDDNDNSLVFLFKENGLKILFTGDSSPFVLRRVSEQFTGKVDPDLIGVDILKIPHHGSKNGLTEEFLRLANPTISVISAGKNNSYGHPSPEVLEMLKALKTKIRRTDEEGDIVFRLRE